MSLEGYSFSQSQAVVDGAWVGCAIDEVNESDLTEARIDAWIAMLKAEL